MGQISGPEVDVIVVRGLGVDEHGLHAQCSRNFEVAHIVFEHGGDGWVDGGLLENTSICRLLGFWREVRMFNPVDGLKDILEPAGFEDVLRISRISIRKHDLAAGEGGDLRGQDRIRRKAGEIKGMDVIEEIHRVDVMMRH